MNRATLASLYTVLLLTLAPALASGEEKMYFEGPKDSRRGELEKAASALTKRLAAHGYSGVAAKVVNESGCLLILIVSDAEITDRMRPKISRLASLAGATAEIRLGRTMTAAERAQFSGGNVDAKKDKAPNGSHWVRSWYSKTFEPSDWETDGKVWVSLLFDEVLVSPAELLKATWDGKNTYTFNAALSKRLVETSLRVGAKNYDSVHLVVDGRILNGGGGFFHWGGIPDFESDPASFKLGTDADGEEMGIDLDAVIRNPMLFGLSKAKLPDPAAPKAPPKPEEAIGFDVPVGTTQADAGKAAAALAKRCVDCGYSKVTATVEMIDGTPVVVLVQEGGWTAERQDSAIFFAKVLCQKLELFPVRRLTDAEREQFERPRTEEEIGKAKAPKGCRWLPSLSWNGADFGPELVLDTPVIAPRIKVFKHAEGTGSAIPWFCDDATIVKKLLVAGQKDGSAAWVLDGGSYLTVSEVGVRAAYIFGAAAPKDGCITLEVGSRKLLEVLQNNPLPFALTVRTKAK